MEAYRAALLERTRARVPLDCAVTQHNLGIALRMMAERSREPACDALEAHWAARDVFVQGHANHYERTTVAEIRKDLAAEPPPTPRACPNLGSEVWKLCPVATTERVRAR